MDGVIWRWLYTPEEFQSKAKAWSNGDTFYLEKIKKMCVVSYYRLRLSHPPTSLAGTLGTT